MLERFVAGDLLETGPDCFSTIKTLRDSKAEHAQTSIVGISTMTLIEIPWVLGQPTWIDMAIWVYS